jgi:hypothetical protein
MNGNPVLANPRIFYGWLVGAGAMPGFSARTRYLR